MRFILACLMFVAVLRASQSLSPHRIPAVIFTMNTSAGACPNEAQQTEAKQLIKDEIGVVLDHLGMTEIYPVRSCSALTNKSPGYYWILPATGPPAVQVYCDFNRQCGCDGPSTWTRVAFLNMSDPSTTCPNNWFTYSSPVRACGVGVRSAGGCNSVTYPTFGLRYNRVCGRALGYQYGDTLGFYEINQIGQSIDQNYLDGLSITHGIMGFRQHIWSFFSARSKIGSNVFSCSCSSSDPWPYNTSFVENDYFCDSGNEGASFSSAFFTADPLWDGKGCGSTSTCCEFNSPPWFCKSLSRPTTDNLEVRSCKQGGTPRDAPVKLIEIYIQ